MDFDMTEWERSTREVSRVVRARMALFLVALASGIGGAYLFLVLAGMHNPDPALRRFIDDPRWDHWLGGPTSIVNLLGALLLLGWSPEKSWRWQSILLVAVCMGGLGFWVVEHSHFFGWNQPNHRGANDPFTVLCLRSIALVRVVTLTDLAAMVATKSTGKEPAPLRRAAILAAVVAFLLWLFLAFTHIDWANKPLRWQNIRDIESFELLAGSILARAVSYCLSAGLCGYAFARLSTKPSMPFQD